LLEEADHILKEKVIELVGVGGARETHCLNLDLVVSVVKGGTIHRDHLGIPIVRGVGSLSVI